MDSQELYDDFEKTFMGADRIISNQYDQNDQQHNRDNLDQDLIYNALHKRLNCKKQMLESFRDYLEVVIKSIDDGEYNEKMIDELCDIIDGYYKNNDDEDEHIAQNMQQDENRLALFSKPKTIKEDFDKEDYESDSQSSKTSNSSTKPSKIKNNDTDNDTSDSDDDNALARFLDSDDDTPPVDIKKIFDDVNRERLEKEKKKKEEREAKEKEEKEKEEREKEAKEEAKQKADRFFESFINKNIDINKRIFKFNSESISYLDKFTKNSFVY
jgi:hypothetical protein